MTGYQPPSRTTLDAANAVYASLGTGLGPCSSARVQVRARRRRLRGRVPNGPPMDRSTRRFTVKVACEALHYWASVSEALTELGDEDARLLPLQDLQVLAANMVVEAITELWSRGWERKRG